MKILAIETSCDETSIAILDLNGGRNKILSNIVSSQVKIHAPYGGVVPMLAKREHQKNLLPILKNSLTEANLLKVQSLKLKIQSYNSKLKILNSKFLILNSILEREQELLKQLWPFLKKYAKPDIDLIAATNGPGLEPALWVGVNFAKALGYFWDLPVMPVNHIEGHIIANWLKPICEISNFQFPISKKNLKSKILNLKSLFPSMCLVVSGGHTQLVLMQNFGKYKILGETRDDAAGEAFDKLAKMLGLSYPGGPIIAAIAAKLKVKNEKLKVKLPRPMINSNDYDFSFSGLKTAALYFVKTLSPSQLKRLVPAICAEFQQAAIDVLVSKTIRAAREYNTKTILLSGGVAANDLLRKTLKQKVYSPSEIEGSKINFFVPPKEFCTDNAAMIALTAALRIKNKESRIKNNLNWQKLTVDANLRLN